MAKKPTSSSDVGLREGFRSGLEDKIADQIASFGHSVEYETKKLKYLVPARLHTYTPDFVLPNGIIIETKGRFKTADRQKHLLIKEQFPDMDIRFIFSNSKNRISKNSQTTYADWCHKHGFLFADKRIPKEWLA